MVTSQSLLNGVVDQRMLTRLYERAKGVKWGLSLEAFEAALARSVASRFEDSGANVGEIEGYLESLHLEDLALAAACAEGRVTAWAYFIECFRPGLRTAARAIAADDGGAELADSLYAELYGLDEREGRRRSLFDYFHGRSRLATWLRAILSQRYVDRIRQERRFDPLDEDAETRVPPTAPAVDPDRLRDARLLQIALARVIRRLDPRDRLRLASYYLQHLTLAQIGRMFGEHEATASRKLERLRRDLRSRVEALLKQEHHLSDEQIGSCFDAALVDTGVDLARALRDGEPESMKQGSAG